MSISKQEQAKEIATKKSEEARARIRKARAEQELNDYIETLRLKWKMQEAKASDELANKHKTRNEKGEETTYWGLVEAHIKDAMRPEQNAYQDWRASMMSLLNMFRTLNEAISISREQVYDRFTSLKVPKTIAEIRDSCWAKLKSKMFAKLTKDKDIDWPTFEHKVTFENGLVNIAEITRKQGMPIDPLYKQEVNDAFRALVDAWLIESGYEPGPANEPGKFYSMADGTELTENEFNALKPSLKNFLDGADIDLTYEERESPSP